MSEVRYQALLKIADMACAYAAATHADARPDLWQTIGIALQDDCPEQSEAAFRMASDLRQVEARRREFLTLLHS